LALTVKKASKLLRRGEPGRYLDSGSAGERGLYLVVGSRTNAHWELRYQIRGRTRWMGLGSARTFSLEEARERAKRERQRLVDKVDPLAIRRAERATQAAKATSALTFAEAAQRYHAQHEAKWSNKKHREQFLGTLREYAFPIIGGLDVAEITTPHVLAVLEQPVKAMKNYPAGALWTARATTASRVRNRIELVFDWCGARGYRAPAAPNPARWSGHLSEVLPEPRRVARIIHHAAVPYAEVPIVMAQLDKLSGVAVKALMFAILTATRTNEVLGACWEEVDLDNAMWTIPAARMKSRREFRQPLARRAIELLKELYTEAGNSYLFIGPKTGTTLSATALVAALRRVGRNETTHGFRSSFSDWSHECTAHSNHTIELCLAHAVGSDVERSYRRGDMIDKRRKLMEQWAAFCMTPPATRQAGKVVAMRGRAL
jgi:integrase